MTSQEIVGERGEILIPDPPVARMLFETIRFSWLWLLLRLALATVWIPAGWGKVTNPNWMNGSALQGFWSNAIAIPEMGQPQITFGWYRNFLTFMLENGWYEWFAPLMAFTELAVGILLLLGAFVGIAAFLGAFLNLNFMLAGVASTNPLLFTAAIMLILAWKVAGWYGMDRWLLPTLGTPWTREERGPAVEPGRTREPSVP